ncbi:MAG: ATP-dependent DNA helicase [Pseudomonadota bacterium]
MNQPANPQPSTQKISLPDIPALCLNAKQAYILSDDGELKTLSHAQASALIHKKPVLVCHAPYVRGRLDADADFFAFDVLELFAFVHPGQFATPTVHGLCKTLGLVPPETLEDMPMTLMGITRALLGDLREDPHAAKAPPLEIAQVMGLNGNGWAWTPFVFSALGETYEQSLPVNSKNGLNVWKNLPEWAEEAPDPPASHIPVTGDEARERLQKLLGQDSEKREEQIQYTTAMTATFAPAADMDEPNVVLTEAGTGVGKTLGYLAPASVWAEKNQSTVWISTYTKNLQRQIDQELDRVYTNPELKDAHVATRKGRENYLCLLNLEETAAGAALAKHPTAAIASGIMARWAVATKDGDLTGGRYPGWLTGILGYHHTAGLADRRGECIYSACDHYHKCFVEHSVRKAKHARIVVANHALVMISAALATPGEDMPSRYVFDEGHHLFDAADSAFAAHLSARETRDLRRWILGNEGGRRQSRARGLKKRAEDLTDGMQDAEEALRKIINAAECLPLDGWTRRLRDGAPSGPTEYFMAEVYKQVFARANGRDGPYSLETQVFPVEESLVERARKLKAALKKLQNPMQDLAAIFHKKLAEDEGILDSDTRKRLDAVSNSLERRAAMTLQAWILMLENLDKGESPPEFVDWMEIERIDGQAIDVGLYRHHVDPMQPFATSVRPHVQGMAVTSATLRDENDDASWEAARKRTGAEYLNPHTQTHGFDSPFNYAEQTKIFIVNDVRKDDLAQVAGAYKALFEAAGGGALGLFTAISRLRAVHEKIASDLEEKAIPLYSQHVDDIDAGTLVDMFREDTNACLLGTDAIRDGVDVPGKSLRLIAFDRTPWPRPTILHKARREAFGGRAYDEMITRLKLKQAFGRLIRRGNDKGVFVMLDPMLPSRLQTAFPKDVEVVKTGLSDVVAGIKEFMGPNEEE